jgi:hypothetical protein
MPQIMQNTYLALVLAKLAISLKKQTKYIKVEFSG